MTKPNAGTIIALLWRASNPYPWLRGLVFVIATITFVSGMFLTPLIVARLLELIQTGQLAGDALWQLALLYGLTQLWSEVLGWRITIYLIWKLEASMQRDMYTKIFAKLATQTLFFHTNSFGGSLVSQASKLVAAVERFWDTLIWSALPLVVSVTGSLIVLSVLFWQYGLFLGLFAVVFALAVWRGSRPLARLSAAEAQASNRVSGRLADVITNIMVVKSSSREAIEARQFGELASKWRTASLTTMWGFLRVSTVYSLVNAGLKIGAIIFAIYAAQHSLISVAIVYLVITYTGTVARELWNMNGIMRSYNQLLGDASAMTTILTTPTSLIDHSDKGLSVQAGAITIDRVTFTHDEGAGATLFKEFSLHIPAGQRVGLVGASGSGKTTLTKLLLRFADVDGGVIRIDGQDIAGVTQASLRQAIAYVPQEPLLFHRSVRANIAYGRPGASEAEVVAAAQQAGAYEFIQQLPQGLDTLVGERGVKLSGGQRQRIAIARAILKDAPILVLDEATSALDSESERLIQRSLAGLMQGRTALVIAHRLSTIAQLDRIVVMEAGRIVEDGGHEELLKQEGAYAKLWRHQSGGFIKI